MDTRNRTITIFAIIIFSIILDQSTKQIAVKNLKGSLPISPAKRPLEDPVYSSPTSRSRKFSPTKLTFNEEEHAATTPARKQVNCTKLETIKDNLKSLTIDDLSQSIDQTMTNIEKLNEKVRFHSFRYALH